MASLPSPDKPAADLGRYSAHLDPATYASVFKDGIRFQQKLALKPGRFRMRTRGKRHEQ